MHETTDTLIMSSYQSNVVIQTHTKIHFKHKLNKGEKVESSI